MTLAKEHFSVGQQQQWQQSAVAVAVRAVWQHLNQFLVTFDGSVNFDYKTFHTKQEKEDEEEEETEI